MALSKEELLAQIQPGEAITAKLLTYIVEFVESQKGPKGDKGDTGAKGDPGAKGADGASIKSIVFTKDEGGAITGGTATLTNNQTVAITVE